MSAFQTELHRRLEEIRTRGLRRSLRPIESPQGSNILAIEHVGAEPKRLLNFSSNDYLGLANDPLLKEAAARAVEKFGTGSGASRLICGSLSPHRELEESLAAFKATEAALAFSSGYNTAVGAVCAIAGTGDVVVLDKLAHASIVDGARLSGATLRVFPHNNLNRLEEILKWARVKAGASGIVLVVTESVFSMDGDCAPLRELVEIKDRHGAWLMLDEAHATGLYGETGRGLADQSGVANRVEIQMGTLGKALGSAGGFICGSRALVDLLINTARPFIFSTAPPPAASAAASRAVEFVQSAAGAARRAALWQNARQLGLRLGMPEPQSAIFPIHIGAEERAMAASDALRAGGFLVPAIRYPTVARGSARLRVTLSATHEPEEISALADAIKAAGLPAAPARPAAD
jgi:8-amino-7-oxononanoate synthase